MIRPLAAHYEGEAEDRELVARARAGDRGALEQLVARHQPWIYNIAIRMLYWPAQAEDATQDILIKVVTSLSTFEGRAAFRTWLYRIVVNHLLNVKRARRSPMVQSLSAYGQALDTTPNLDLPDQRSSPADVHLLVKEAQIGCTAAMLLCLDDEQRLIYILGEIFGVTDVVAAELLDVSRDNYRQKLSRTRRDLHSFMHGQCGLVNGANPCRCARKTRAFVEAGYINPSNLQFAKERVTYVKAVAEQRLEALSALDDAYGAVYRDHPFHQAPDFVASLKALLDRPEVKAILER